MTCFYYTGGTGAVFKHNGFNTNTKKEPKIIRDYALLNADEDDEMVSINKRFA